MSAFAFHLDAEDSGARLGRLETPRGVIRTPAFMPVGTAATVKALMMDQVRATGADIILANTYHLMLRPGAERIARLGGLHAFSRWDGPILTDSGGYQVFSLKELRQLDEDGVTFKSHLDGSAHRLTPERAIEIQADLLGADIIMQLDECTDFPATRDAARLSLELSARWAARCKTAFGIRDTQALFGIVQGSTYAELRAESAQRLIEMGFDGYAVGGLAVGEGHDAMMETLAVTIPHLPEDRPRYLMGVGKPMDIVGAIARGVDMFDCVLPTRSGRHGQAWTDAGPLNLKNAQYAEDTSVLDESLDCPASRDYTKAYLHHLVRSGEMLGSILLSWHNVAYFEGLTARARAAISAGHWTAFAADLAARRSDRDARSASSIGFGEKSSS